MDRCTFLTASPLDPSEIRRTLFREARSLHPIVGEAERERAIAAAAERLGCTARDVASSLFGDLADNQQLADFEELSPEDLLDEYNLAQAQALLYRAVSMQLWVEPQEPAGYRRIFGAIKNYGLIHTIRGNAALGYEVRLDGPVSMFHRSQKYGVQMAVFLPALLACDGWRMRAEVDAKTGTAFFELDSAQTRLRSDDVTVVRDQAAALEKFVAAWTSRGYGTAEPTREVIDLGGSAFIPDAVLRPEDGPEVFLEVLGFWTPKFVKERLEELARGGFRRFVVAASEEYLASRDTPSDLGPGVVIYKSSLDPKAVRAAIDRIDAV
jgi:predicted nuclease of restriction endonuclease-like RecB superfamily